MGTWSFRARLGGNHARAAAAAGQPVPGPGPGSGSGSGSLPGTDPLRVCWTANSCDCWVEPLQRFRPNRCNCSVGFGPKYPSRSVINSAPLLSNKTHQLSLRSEVRSSLSLCLQVTSNEKWEISNSVFEATSKRFCKIHSERGLRAPLLSNKTHQLSLCSEVRSSLSLSLSVLK